MKTKALLAVAVVVTGLAFGSESSLAATSGEPYTIRIKTTPALAGLRFTLDGRDFATDGSGIARIGVPRLGAYELRATARQTSESGNQVRFARWLDNAFTPDRTVEISAPTTTLEAGFTVMYPIHLSYIDFHDTTIDPSDITAVTLTNSLGERVTFSGTKTDHWLLGSRVARLANGLYETEIKYGVDSVMVQGSNVVNHGQQQFLPAKGSPPPIQLLFYSAKVSAHDAFFGFGLGSGIRVVYPNRKVEHYDFDEGSQVTLPALPRGKYEISVEGPGWSFVRPLALSKDQEVSLEVLSYLDIAAVLLCLLSLSAGLVLVGRPHLRKRVVAAALAVPRVPGRIRALGTLLAHLTGALERVRPGRPRGREPAEQTVDHVPAKEGSKRIARMTWSLDHRVSVTAPAFLFVSWTCMVKPRRAPGWRLAVAGARIEAEKRARAGRVARFLSAVFVLAAIAAALVGPARAATPRIPQPVLAYYYIWFDPSSWNRAKTDYPELGRYSSAEQAVIRQHIEWAKDVGIDGFIVSWKSTATLNERLEKLVEIADQENFKLSIIYQGLDFERDPLPADRVEADLRYFVDNFADDPAFQIFGKPLVVWSGTWEFSSADVADVTSSLRKRLLILASEHDEAGYARLSKYVDGDAYYWSSANPYTFPEYPERLQRFGRAVHANNGLWIPPAAPGFDARLVGGTSVVPRNDGETLRRELDAAVGSSPDAIGIISWNEFSENSHIEPSKKYGGTYLRVLADVLGAEAPVIEGFDSDAPAATGFNYGLPLIVAFVLVFVAGLALRRGRHGKERQHPHEDKAARQEELGW